jgi:hypothetical protein
MEIDPDITLERVAELLRALPPAPPAWVAAAKALPAARAGLDELVARARADAAVRAELLADLEAALTQQGLTPEPELVDLLRRRLEA